MHFQQLVSFPKKLCVCYFGKHELVNRSYQNYKIKGRHIYILLFFNHSQKITDVNISYWTEQRIRNVCNHNYDFQINIFSIFIQKMSRVINQLDSLLRVENSEELGRVKKQIVRKSAKSEVINDSKSSAKIPRITEIKTEFKPIYLKGNSSNGVSSKDLLNFKTCQTTKNETLRLQTQIEKKDSESSNYKNYLGKSKSELIQRLISRQQLLQLKNKELEERKSQQLLYEKKIQDLQGKLLSKVQASQKMLQQLENTQKQNKSLQFQKKKLQSEKNSLDKKIQFLENINFSTQTKNIQSYREQYLEKQLEVCKQKLDQNRTNFELVLEKQLTQTKQKLFNANRIIQALQISSKCMQAKIKQNKISSNFSQQYAHLKTKYKKTINELKEVRKQYINLLRDYNKRMQNQTIIDFSLSISQY